MWHPDVLRVRTCATEVPAFDPDPILDLVEAFVTGHQIAIPASAWRRNNDGKSG
jgi:hypothetical protein